MFAVLAALIFSTLAIVYRSKIANPTWRAWWDWTLFVTGVVPSIIFGVAFGNLFLGVPFGFDADLRFHSDITLLGLLRPFALLVGLTSLAMIALHGATWLSLKADGAVARRARTFIPFLAAAFVILFIADGIWLRALDGFTVANGLAHDGPSKPKLQTVVQTGGGWFANYHAVPLLWIAPLLALAGALAATLLRTRALPAFIGSALTCAATIATAGLALFPFLLPSSSQPNASLTVWDASSSKLTLVIMLAVTAIFLPLIVLYTSWVYRVMRGPVRVEDITNDRSAY